MRAATTTRTGPDARRRPTSRTHPSGRPSSHPTWTSRRGPVTTYSHDPHGNPTGTTGTISNPFRYAGEYHDTESGLIYLRARYYDPTTAQFLTRDPLAAMSREAYSYGSNNSTNNTDPTGLLCLGDLCASDFDWRDGAKGLGNFGVGFANAALGSDFCGWDGAGQAWSRNIGSVMFHVEVAILSAGTGSATSIAAAGRASSVRAASSIPKATRIGDWAYKSRWFGADSYLFGNASVGTHTRTAGGLLNRTKPGPWKLGWSVDKIPGTKIAFPGFRLKTPLNDHTYFFHASGF